IYGFVHPGGYADEHITHYTHDSLVDELTKRGLEVLDIRYIAKAEIVIRARKPGTATGRMPMFTQASFDRALVCPEDHASLELRHAKYVCTRCVREYPIVNSIPDFMPRQGSM